MTAAKIQHYVPQFLLRNFGTGKKDYVWVLDKSSDTVFKSNAKNIASESRFYDFQVGTQSVSLESSLSKLETAAKPIIEQLLESDSVAGLTNKNRATLAAFLAVQFVRTKAFRAQWSSFPRSLREHMGELGEQVEPGSEAAQILEDLNENDLKAQTGKFLADAPSLFAPSLLDKVWSLAATTNSDPFILGDHPLALQNNVKTPLRGNLGLVVPGIEIYMPLSPVRALALWCPTLVETIRTGARQIRGLPEWLIQQKVPNARNILNLDAALKQGTPIEYRRQNVQNFNSLQVRWSERYLFANHDSFELAREMIAGEPSFRSGVRMKFH